MGAIFVNTPEANTPLHKASKDDFVSEKKTGGAGGTRTPCLFNARPGVVGHALPLPGQPQPELISTVQSQHCLVDLLGRVNNERFLL